MTKLPTCVLSLAACAATAAPVRVSRPDELYRALERAQKSAAAPHEIVLRAGDYFLPRTLVLKGLAASNITIRAEKPGAATLYGGVKLAGWTRERGTPFYVARVPDWKPGISVPFRSLVVNGEWAPIATYPGGTNRLSHTGRFDLPLLSALAGHWPRKPTREELVTMPYRPEDLDDAMRLENADIRLYHMWSDSLCTVSNVDRKAHVLCVREEPAWPMGARNRRQYEVLNVREGLSAPGTWYLDRDTGRVHYWPRPGENPSRLVVVAPTLRRVISVEGERWNPRARIPGLALRNLTVMACTPGPEERGSFGGSSISAAVSLVGVRDVTLENVAIRNVGGAGLLVANGRNVRVSGCDVSFTGARGAGFDACSDCTFADSRIADVGLIYRSSCGMGFGGSNMVARANEICRAPYCGIIGGGSDNLYESNTIHHVMQVLHDGAAIYGGLQRSVMRGNVVRDIVANGQGFGVHAYYADEGSRDCVIEDNYAEGVGSLVHNHMTLRTVVRNNRLVSPGDLAVSFQGSADCTFSNNTLVCDGRLTVSDPDAVPHWERNVVVRAPDAKPQDGLEKDGVWTPVRPPKKAKPPVDVPRAAKAPALDGVFASGEWTERRFALDRTRDGRGSGFSTANVRFAWDDECLYAALMAASYGDSPVSLGSTWGMDDGVGLELPNGVRVRGYLSGANELKPSAAGIRAWTGRDPAVDPKKPWQNQNVGHYEFAIPWTALGLEPKPGLKIRFNAFAYVSEQRECKYWEGATGSAPEDASAEEPTGTLVLQ